MHERSFDMLPLIYICDTGNLQQRSLEKSVNLVVGCRKIHLTSRTVEAHVTNDPSESFLIKTSLDKSENMIEFCYKESHSRSSTVKI